MGLAYWPSAHQQRAGLKAARSAARSARFERLGIDLLLLGAFGALISGVVLLAERWHAPIRTAVEIDLSPLALPGYTLLSLSRGFAAYLLSLAFTLVYGTVAAHSSPAKPLDAQRLARLLNTTPASAQTFGWIPSSKRIAFARFITVNPRTPLSLTKMFEPPPSNEKLTRDATRAGAVIGSNSWGEDTQGSYDLSAMEFDALVRDADTNTPGDQPYILEFSAGNAGPGPQTVASPAVAKNVIATGASQSSRSNFPSYSDGINAMADISSRGPCDDGRIKPDLVAPGTWIASLKSESASGVYAWQGISTNYVYEGGTSQAGPHVAGAAAVFVQYYRLKHTNATPSPALVKMEPTP